MARRSSQKSKPGRLRIVSGKWRSRLLQVADDPTLRPTSERIRETLFNWLSPELQGAACLDLFAGSGALGLEALSRGAGHTVFVERSKSSASVLRKNIASLETADAEVMTADAMQFLASPGGSCFDIVFLDPPFAADLYEELCRLLQENGWLVDDAKIYLEQPRDANHPRLPDGWQVLKEQTAGNVRYFLLKPT